MTETLPGESRQAKLDDLWRTHYRANRYARLLSQEELNRRIRDLIVNFVILTREAKIAPLPPARSTFRWLELLTHVFEEMRLRHGPYPNGYSRDIFSEPFPDLVGDLGKKAAPLFHGKGLEPGNTLIKFGRAQFMRGLYERGALRVQPASFFSAPDHNSAVRDDELWIALSLVLTRNDVVSIVVNPEDVPLDIKDQRLDLGLLFETDYWLYCVTSSIEPRLFPDFAADSCVIIRDKQKFRERLLASVKARLPDAQSYDGPATYIDPLLPRTGKIQIPFAKHFRYSYQDEFRFVWLPAKASKKLDHVDLEIGALEDIAELLEL